MFNIGSITFEILTIFSFWESIHKNTERFELGESGDRGEWVESVESENWKNQVEVSFQFRFSAI